MTKKTVIITGASRGVGAAAAFVAAGLGANVVLAARTAAALEEHVSRIRNDGGSAISIPTDVSRTADCHRLIEQSVIHFGRIDALINNAGIIDPVDLFRHSDMAELHHNLTVNLIAPMVLTQAALPQLRQHQGRIVNVSSGGAINAIPGLSGHCTAKAGLNQFNRVLAAEEEDVVTLAFRPGVVDTQLQATIRENGKQTMPANAYTEFADYYQNGELLPPQVPGGALAILALYAPVEWSGQFLAWDDPRIQKLRMQYAAGH